MRKLLTILVITLSLPVFSQILNKGFEQLTSKGKISYWGDLILLPIVLDSSGQYADTVVFDQDFYFSTSDAHTGQRAMEMRNAQYKQTKVTIAGRSRLSNNDTDYTPFTAPVNAIGRPHHLSFYHKFIPAGKDTAYAYLRLYDSLQNLIGEAISYISKTASVYQLISAPVVYTSTDVAAFMEIGFATAKPGSIATFGTRLLIDDIDLIVSGIDKVPHAEQVSVYPNPLDDNIFISVHLAADDVNVFAVDGRQIPVGVTSTPEKTMVSMAGTAQDFTS